VFCFCTKLFALALCVTLRKTLRNSAVKNVSTLCTNYLLDDYEKSLRAIIYIFANQYCTNMIINIFSSFPSLKNWDSSFFDYLPRIFLALLAIVVFYLFAKIIRNYSLKAYTKVLKKQTELASFISSTLYVVLIFAGIFLALDILGLEGVVTKLLAGAGIIGIVAGFAFKDIASNIFGGLVVNIQKPFKDGDWVDIDGKFGTINKIGWITTTIKTTTGQEIFVPNQIIYNNTFTNFSTYNKRRIVLQSAVTHDDDLELVKRVTLDEINQIESLLKTEIIDFYFTSIGSYAYNFEVRFWVKYTQNPDYLSAMSEGIMRIKKRFKKEGIKIAYPVQSLDFGKNNGVNIYH